MDRSYDAITFISKYLYFKKTVVANFDDIIKIVAVFIKTIFKDSRKIKRIRIMYQNAIYICISLYSKIC